RSLAYGCFAIQTSGVHELFHRLFETPSTGVEIYVHSDPRGAIARQTQDLPLRRRVVRIEAGAHQHLFAIQRPSFDEHRIFVLPPDFVIQMIRDRELEKMSRNSFVSEDRPRVFNRRANIKILRLRIVSWDEKESG